jgi:glutamate/tyrosine decarboxylase-like PLP-dependent enzyme
MNNPNYAPLLRQTCETAIQFIENVDTRPVGRPSDYAALLESLGGPLPNQSQDPLQVIGHLNTAAQPGLVATPGPRYFGLVIGGSVPAALAADWLTSTWDQNACMSVVSPAAAVAEEISRQWLLDLFGLPPEMSLGLTTGATMANFTALAAARHALLRNQGWDVEEQGLFGAPPIAVVTSEESHITIFAALQMLGLGRGRVVRMRADALREVLAAIATPFVVCAQAGNVNTGAFDPLPEIAAAVHLKSGWLHVDGAFGVWAAATPRYAALVRGIDHADSITVDAHKWLNVPYDCGFVFVRDRAAHQTAMTLNAPYYAAGEEAARDNHNWVPEASRRARGFAVYAALRSLGRQGLAELVERCCTLARRMASRLAEDSGVTILNEVVLNQVLVRFGSDDHTAQVIRRIQQDGTCWAGGTTWHGMHAMRMSVSNWSTTEADIDASADAILRCAGGRAFV